MCDDSIQTIGQSPHSTQIAAINFLNQKSINFCLNIFFQLIPMKNVKKDVGCDIPHSLALPRQEDILNRNWSFPGKRQTSVTDPMNILNNSLSAHLTCHQTKNHVDEEYKVLIMLKY